MEDDLNFKVNGRQHQFQGIMEHNPNLLAPASPELDTAQPQLVQLYC